VAIPAAGAGAGSHGAGVLHSVTLDAQGRVTGTSDAAASDLPAAGAGAGAHGAGVLKSVTLDAQGRVTATADAAAADLPAAGAGAGVHGTAMLKSVTLDAQGRVTATTDGVDGTDFSKPHGPLQKYLARAIAFAGLPTDDTLGWFFEDFPAASSASGTTAPPGWTLLNASTGTVSCTSVGRGGGWMRASSGATAGARGEADGANGSLSADITSHAWYFAVKFALSTAATAQSILSIGIFNLAGTKGISCGFMGGLNAANFVVQYDGAQFFTLSTGSALDLGVAKDTADHVVEFYGKGGTTLFARIDGGAELNHAMASAPTDAITGINTTARNGTDNVVRSIDADWVLFAYVRT